MGDKKPSWLDLARQADSLRLSALRKLEAAGQASALYETQPEPMDLLYAEAAIHTIHQARDTLFDAARKLGESMAMVQEIRRERDERAEAEMRDARDAFDAQA